jgi:hypothetical protein
MKNTIFYVLIGLLCLTISIYILRNMRESFKGKDKDDKEKKENNESNLDYKDSSATKCNDPSLASEACLWCKGKKHNTTIEYMEKNLQQMVKSYSEILDDNPCGIEIFQTTISKNKKLKNTLKKIIETILK